MFEHYDKGYVLSGAQYRNGLNLSMLVLKRLSMVWRWSKSFGYTNQDVIFMVKIDRRWRHPNLDFKQIKIRLYRSTDRLNNACGEKNGAKIYNSPELLLWRHMISSPTLMRLYCLSRHWTNNQQNTYLLFIGQHGGYSGASIRNRHFFVDEVSYSLERHRIPVLYNANYFLTRNCT